MMSKIHTMLCEHERGSTHPLVLHKHSKHLEELILNKHQQHKSKPRGTSSTKVSWQYASCSWQCQRSIERYESASSCLDKQSKLLEDVLAYGPILYKRSKHLVENWAYCPVLHKQSRQAKKAILKMVQHIVLSCTSKASLRGTQWSSRMKSRMHLLSCHISCNNCNMRFATVATWLQLIDTCVQGTDWLSVSVTYSCSPEVGMSLDINQCLADSIKWPNSRNDLQQAAAKTTMCNCFAWQAMNNLACMTAPTCKLALWAQVHKKKQKEIRAFRWQTTSLVSFCHSNSNHDANKNDRHSGKNNES